MQTHPQQGYIKINSLMITAGQPGVDDPASWSGKYFQDIPLTITAVPNPGYEFVGWAGSLEYPHAEMIINLDEDITLTAVFREI